MIYYKSSSEFGYSKVMAIMESHGLTILPSVAEKDLAFGRVQLAGKSGGYRAAVAEARRIASSLKK